MPEAAPLPEPEAVPEDPELPDATSTAVVDEVLDDVVDDEDVVGQSPRVISSSFVAASAMQVPSLPPVLSALLHPHVPVQSAPHLMLPQGSTVAVVVMVVDVEGNDVDEDVDVDVEVSPPGPEDPEP